MRHILRQREWTADRWRYAGEDGSGTDVIVPLAELRADAERVLAAPGRHGVRLTPVDRVEELAPYLPRLALVAVEFPNPGDGRGYSSGRILRQRLGFGGELRAVGAGVKQDQVFLLARCGFDAIELAPGEDVAAAQVAFARYDTGYEPGAPQLPLRRQRFFAA
jgi:uncharacterized protein (DUF934 family)